MRTNTSSQARCHIPCVWIGCSVAAVFALGWLEVDDRKRRRRWLRTEFQTVTGTTAGPDNNRLRTWCTNISEFSSPTCTCADRAPFLLRNVQRSSYGMETPKGGLLLSSPPCPSVPPAFSSRAASHFVLCGAGRDSGRRNHPSERVPSDGW